MKRAMAIGVSIAAACGSAAVTTDSGNGSARDAALGDSALDSVGSAPAGSGSSQPVNCQDYTAQTIAASGARTVQTNSIALVAGVAPGDKFLITTCYGSAFDPYSQPPCPAGATCSGALYPIGPHCSADTGWSFANGELMVICGASTTQYNGSGAVTSSSAWQYASISVEKF